VDLSDIPAGLPRRALGGGYLLPGFIDTQVNGGGGVMFGEAPSVEAIRAIGAVHRRYGTTGFLPTLISGDLDAIRRAIEATRQGLEQGVPGLLGLHIEGPFINVERKGIHDASKFRVIDPEAFEILTSLGQGVTLVTLAPETTSPGMIQRLADRGVIVSAGHTDAAYAEIRSALDHGLRGFTHLFNAMSPLTSREPGAVGAALEDQERWCALIVDGKHVDPVVLRLALKAKRHDRFLLVTDAMPCVGSAENTFMLDGRRITVKDGVCVDEQGTLAGSDLDMASALRNAVALLGLRLEDAARMASRNPAEFLALGPWFGRIAPGARADLVLLDETLHAVETWIGGRDASADGVSHG
jgi:N-acetylglucosamine-6-phosphate deacetylase